LGLSDNETASLSLASTITSAVCCVVGGLLSDRFGRRRMLATYVIAMSIPTLALAYQLHSYGWIFPVVDPETIDRAATPSALITSLWAATLAFAVFQGLMYGTRTALFMDVCKPAVAATQFTAYMALLNLVLSYSAAWQGWAIAKYGYPTTLMIDAAIGLIGLSLLPLMRPQPKVSNGTGHDS
ncbi:MAG: MFS transporter, partial [Planctomycetota bacterium]